MNGTLGILAFIIAMLFSIMVHEWGHFITARTFGMKVTEFFLGFGPRIWSTKRGETEFGIKAIPAGGYCRITGMVPTEQLSESDAPRAFYKSTVSRRLIVLGAGSFLHFLLAWLILILFFAAVGTPEQTTRLGQVLPCIKVSSEPCTSADPLSPASKAGLRVGDQIVAISGELITSWSQVGDSIRAAADKELIFTVERAGEELEIPVRPLPLANPSGETPQIVGIVGILSERENVRKPIFSAIGQSAREVANLIAGSARALVALPSKIPALFSATFGSAQRDPEGLVGVVGVARVSGEAAASETGSLAEKIGFLLLIVASLNVFVGIFNLIPLLPLDGGHMAVALLDGFRGFRARRKGLPPPPPFDVTRLLPFTFVVIALLASLSLLLLFADIVNPLRLNQ
jgi:membrane-associated protease RseP (regulator of RpoE activity)